MNEPNQPYDASSPSQLEQRLQKLKPRQPILDIEAIAKKADAKPVDQAVTAIVSQSKSWYSTKVLAGTVAASWVCGVAVGASVVFFSLSKAPPTADDSKIAGKETVEQHRETTALTPSPTSQVESMFAEKSMQAPSDFSGWDFGLGTEPLQVGMSLRSRNRLVRTGAMASTNAMTRNSERGSNDLQNAIGSYEDVSTPMPTNPITQAELLKSLLQDANKDIH